MSESITEWNAPSRYTLSSKNEKQQLIQDMGVTKVVDALPIIADDLFELRHTDKMDDSNAREVFTDDLVAQGEAYGEWVHYPWENSLVHFPDEDDYYRLRTFRNQTLISAAEQQVLRAQKVAAFGLSVGRSVVESTVRTGIGNSYLLFDPDRISPTNLNRLDAGMDEVGLLKTTSAGRKVAKVDPFLEQSHFADGYNSETDDILRRERPDVIIEEVDDIIVKERLRSIARELGVPLVMAGDVADKSVIHIERHDLGEVKPFNGKVSQKLVNKMREGALTKGEQDSALIGMLGFMNLSPRLLQASTMRGVEVAGFPQLGTTATVGGALTAVAIRDILLGRSDESIVTTHDTRRTLKSKRPSNLRETADIVKKFVAYRKESR